MLDLKCQGNCSLSLSLQTRMARFGRVLPRAFSHVSLTMRPVTLTGNLPKLGGNPILQQRNFCLPKSLKGLFPGNTLPPNFEEVIGDENYSYKITHMKEVEYTPKRDTLRIKVPTVGHVENSFRGIKALRGFMDDAASEELIHQCLTIFLEEQMEKVKKEGVDFQAEEMTTARGYLSSQIRDIDVENLAGVLESLKDDGVTPTNTMIDRIRSMEMNVESLLDFKVTAGKLEPLTFIKIMSLRKAEGYHILVASCQMSLAIPPKAQPVSDGKFMEGQLSISQVEALKGYAHMIAAPLWQRAAIDLLESTKHGDA